MKVNKFLFFIGKFLSAILAGAVVSLLSGLALLQMLPTTYLVVAGALLFGVVALILILTWSGRGKVKMPIGLVLAVIMLFATITGTVYVLKTVDMLESISESGTETVHVGIYVRSDDTNDYNAVSKDYCYGILKKLDRESTDIILQQMTQTFGKSPTCLEFQSLPELIKELLDGKVDAIILNQEYLTLLGDMIDDKDILSRIRETALQQVEIKNDDPNDEASADGLKPFGIYISGIDSRGTVSVRGRSDVNIMAVINPAEQQVLLISTPRDYYVPLSISDGIPDKLTHAGNYGVEVSKETMAMLYGVEMDYYFRVNFSGFEKIIDALGGITVHSDYSFEVAGYPSFQYQKGDNQLDGKAALAFCRERYSFSTGDQQRGKNQMAVIQGVMKKALSPALLQNYVSVLKAMEGSFKTDVPMELIGALVARQLDSGGEWNVITYSVDGKSEYRIPYSLSFEASVMIPNYDTVEHAKELLQKAYNGEIVE